MPDTKRFITAIRPYIVSLVITLALFMAAAIGFISLAEEVREGDTLWLDETILRSINHLSSPFLDIFFKIVTQLGGIVGVGIITIIGILVSLRRRKYYQAIFMAFSVGGAGLVNLVLKVQFGRQRPDLWQHLVTEQSFSFPSGHAMASSALACTLVALAWRTKWRIPALVAGVLYVLLVALSRLYLGVHYPTDIVAGWLVSLCWVMVVAGVLAAVYYRRHGHKKPDGLA